MGISGSAASVDRRPYDFVNEADVLVFAGHYARNDLAPGDLGIDDGLAPAPPVVDHHDEILHGVALFAPEAACGRQANYFVKSEISQEEIRKIRK
jgi:hypothetical protein